MCIRDRTRTDDIAQIRKADVPLDELLMPAEVKRKVVLALAEPTPTHAPLRLVLRGRRGAGRHSLIAAVASRIEREIVAIDTARLPHARRELVASLRTALFRASLHGLVPVLSGLEQIDPTDVEVRDAVRQVLRTHPGPLVVRTSPEGTLPLDPGFVSVDLPPLLLIPTLIGIMVLNFVIINAAPGGPVEQVLARIKGTAVDATARIGGTVGDISWAVESYVRSRPVRYGIVAEYTGHGIGTAMHQPPDVPNLGRKGRGPTIVRGMCLAR